MLVDSNLKTWLLEINDHPSLNIFLEKDYMGGGCGKSLSQVDLYVKKTIVGDALKLIRKSEDKITALNKFRSLTRVFPSESESNQVMETLNKIRSVYYDIAAVKQKENISS